MDITLHFVLSALVGGNTGKSTLVQMLMAYLCQRTGSVAIIDTSYNATMYHDIKKIFEMPKEMPFRSYYYYFHKQNKENASLVDLLCYRPANITEQQNANKTAQAISDVVENMSHFVNHRSGHVICETNLSQTLTSREDFIRRITERTHRVFFWTTWNTKAFLDETEYRNLLMFDSSAGTYPHIHWIFVHNPFVATVGAPEGHISKSMKDCYDLPIDREAWTANQLLNKCCIPAVMQAEQLNTSAEEIWQSAYNVFSERGSRPYNILPVFCTADTHWQLESINGFANTKISTPEDIPSVFKTKVRESFFTLFEEYFSALKL